MLICMCRATLYCRAACPGVSGISCPLTTEATFHRRCCVRISARLLPLAFNHSSSHVSSLESHQQPCLIARLIYLTRLILGIILLSVYLCVCKNSVFHLSPCIDVCVAWSSSYSGLLCNIRCRVVIGAYYACRVHLTVGLEYTLVSYSICV